MKAAKTRRSVFDNRPEETMGNYSDDKGSPMPGMMDPDEAEEGSEPDDSPMEDMMERAKLPSRMPLRKAMMDHAATILGRKKGIR